MISSKDPLVHYDAAELIVISCDASSYGLIGAVLYHVIDGEKRQAAFASRSLTSAEKNYAQIGREALSIIFAVKSFHNYLFARSFTILTDKPLLGLFGSHKPLLEICSLCMSHWFLPMTCYLYSIIYREANVTITSTQLAACR